MKKHFSVIAYNSHNLMKQLLSKTLAPKELIVSKNHFHYFREYFNYLITKTIVVENNYVDRDYLEDYSAYYVRCFTPYEKTCTRLHFFTKPFSRTVFQNILRNNISKTKIKEITESYLGFVVIKPLPMTIIGRTCLKTYPNEKKRNYPIIRDYKTNLFGIKLTVDSLAFQEQDSVVAACATSALWSTFHGTGILFHHSIPSPVIITEKASKKFPSLTRTLPSNGLLIEQMVQAIRNVGLEPYSKSAADYFLLKSTIYAYIKAKIPIVLLINLANKVSSSYKLNKDTPLYIDMGKHAVAVTGYSIKRSTKINFEQYGFRCVTSNIDKIYVHDDHVGPFSRMIFDDIKISVYSKEKDKNEEFMSLGTSWRDKNEKYGNIRAIPDIMLIPLYHKIRIPFSIIQDATINFNAILNSFILEGFMPFKEYLIWDMYLITVSDLKNEILRSVEIKSETKLKLLTFPMPKYIWRSTGLNGKNKIIDLLFDATDIEQGPLFIFAIEYEVNFSIVLHEICKSDNIKKHNGNGPEQKIIQWFRNKENDPH